MAYELDQLYWLFTGRLDPSLEAAAKQARDTYRKTAEAAEGAGRRAEKAIGEGTRAALADIAKAAPAAAAAGKKVGDALGDQLEATAGASGRRARDAMGRFLKQGAGPAGRDAGKAAGDGLNAGLKGSEPALLRTTDEMIAQVEQRWKLRMAKLQIAETSGRYADDPDRLNLLRARATALHDVAILRRMGERRSAGALSDGDVVAFADALKVRVPQAAHEVDNLGASLTSLAAQYLAPTYAAAKFAEMLKADWEAADRLDASVRKLQGVARMAGIDLVFLERVAAAANAEFKLGTVQSNNYATELSKLTSKAGQIEKTGDAIRALLDIGAARGLDSAATLQAIQQAILGIDEGTDKLFGKNPSVIYAEQAAALGTTVGAMTDAQKAQALLNEVLQKGTTVGGEYVNFLKSQAGQAAQSRIRQEELAAQTGKNTEAIREMTRAAKESATGGVAVLTASLGGLVEFLGEVLSSMGKIIDAAPLLGAALRRARNAIGGTEEDPIAAQRPFLGILSYFYDYANRPGPLGARQPLNPNEGRSPFETQIGGFQPPPSGAGGFRPRGRGAQAPYRPAEQADIDAAEARVKAIQARGETTTATIRATRSEEEFRRAVERSRQEVNRAATEEIRLLRLRGASDDQLGGIAGLVKDPTPGGGSGRGAARAADRADDQVEIRAKEIQLLRQYWEDAASAPEELKRQVSDVIRLERELNRVEGERANLRRAGRDTAEAGSVFADLEAQRKAATELLAVLGPLEAQFARDRENLDRLRPTMTEADFQATGHAIAQAYDEGIEKAAAANPALAAALRRHLKGALDPAAVAKGLVDEFTVALDRESTAAAVARLLGESTPEAAEAAGAGAALQFVAALRQRIAEAADDPALQEQLIKLLPQGLDRRALGLEKIELDFFGDGQAESAIAALAQVQEAVRGVAEAQQELALVERSRDPAVRAAAELRVAAAQAVVRQRVDAVRAGLKGAQVPADQMAFATEKLAGALSSAQIPARDMADSIGSLAGKVALVQGLADAFLKIAGSGASDEMRDILGGISDVAGAIGGLDSARRNLAKAQASGSAGLGDQLAVLGGYGALAGGLISLGRSIIDRGEQQRLAMIQQTVATLRNTDALEEFNRSAISNVSADERASLLSVGESFAKMIEKLTAPLKGVFGDGKSAEVILKTITAQQIEFLTKLEQITGASFFDASKGTLNYAEFLKAWKAFQSGDLGSFGSDAAGKIDAFEFLIQQLGDAAGDSAARVRLLIDQLREADDLKGTRFADELQKVFDEQGADAAKKWLQELVKVFTEGGPDAAELVALFGSGLTAEEIQRILSTALSTVAGEGGGAVGGGSNEKRVSVGGTEVQFNAALLQWATQTELQGRIADTADAIYQAITGVTLASVQPRPIPVPTVAQVQAIANGGSTTTTTYEIAIDMSFGDMRFEFPEIAGSGPKAVADGIAAAGSALGDTIGERVAAAIRGAGGTGRVRISTRSGGLRS